MGAGVQETTMSEPTPTAGPNPDPFEIPEGIRRSREALKRDLPALLANRRLHWKCVLYANGERIGIHRDDLPLLREAFRRGYRDDEIYVGIIEPGQFEYLEEDGPEIDP
jgi:hypothetical protein